jgi:hypothetical protein
MITNCTPADDWFPRGSKSIKGDHFDFLIFFIFRLFSLRGSKSIKADHVFDAAVRFPGFSFFILNSSFPRAPASPEGYPPKAYDISRYTLRVNYKNACHPERSEEPALSTAKEPALFVQLQNACHPERKRRNLPRRRVVIDTTVLLLFDLPCLGKRPVLFSTVHNPVTTRRSGRLMSPILCVRVSRQTGIPEGWNENSPGRQPTTSLAVRSHLWAGGHRIVDS